MPRHLHEGVSRDVEPGFTTVHPPVMALLTDAPWEIVAGQALEPGAVDGPRVPPAPWRSTAAPR